MATDARPESMRRRHAAIVLDGGPWRSKL